MHAKKSKLLFQWLLSCKQQNTFLWCTLNFQCLPGYRESLIVLSNSKSSGVLCCCFSLFIYFFISYLLGLLNIFARVIHVE